MSNGIVWNEGQRNALVKLTEFVNTETPPGDYSASRIICVNGGPGSGKSTVINQLQQRLLQADPEFKICCTATTHAAVSVLLNNSKKNGTYHPRVEMKTIHALFGFVPSSSSFQRYSMKTKEHGAKDFNLVIIDEASMLAQYHIEEVESEAEELGFKVIFIYDQAQLGPVLDYGGSGDTYYKVPIHEMGYPKVVLNEYVRFANGGLESLARLAREYCMKSKPLNVKRVVAELGITKDDGVEIMRAAQARRELHHAFTSPDSDLVNNPSKTRVLAYTNSKTMEWSDLIRKMIYGKQFPRAIPDLVVGERVTFRETFTYEDEEGMERTCNNNADMIVTNIEEGYFIEDRWDLENATVENYTNEFGDELKRYVDFPTYEGWLVTGDYLDMYTGKKKQVKIPFIPRNKRSPFKRRLKQLFEAADSETNKEAKKRCWQSYHKFKALFADLVPTVASTVHKSQGSTFETVYVCVSDINCCKDPEDKARLWTVALSRAQSRVVLII